MQRCKVGAQVVLLPPAVEQNAGVRAFRFLVKAPGVQDELYGKAPFPEAHRRAPEGGARVAVDQGQLPFVVADQRRDIRFVAQNFQGVAGGDPAAAHLRRGAQTIAVLLLWNVALVIDEIRHDLGSTGCCAM